MKRYDAVVVGARVAGASTAMLLARQGLSVLLVERSRHGSDTLSTLALMRGAVLQLSRWGVLDALEAAGTPAIRSTSFHYDDEVIDIAIKPRDGVGALYAPRRTVLDALLVDRAAAAGVDVWYGVRLVGLLRDAGGRVCGAVVEDPEQGAVRIDAGIVIGADGARSTVAGLVGAETLRTGRHASGVVYGFWSGLDQPGNDWYFSPGLGAGAIPTNDGETLVFASTTSSRFREEIRFDIEAGYRRMLEACAPGLAARLERAERFRSLRGFAGHLGFMRQSNGPGWALVGDAAYFKDPITAHGITDALRDAELLARAVVRGGDDALAGYQTLRDELSVPLFDITDEIAAYAWDLDRVKQLHVEMSAEMNREVKALLSVSEAPWRIRSTVGVLV